MKRDRTPLSIRGTFVRAFEASRRAGLVAWAAGLALFFADGSFVPSPMFLRAASPRSRLHAPAADPTLAFSQADAHALLDGMMLALLAWTLFALLSSVVQPGYLRIQRSALSGRGMLRASDLARPNGFARMLSARALADGCTTAAALAPIALFWVLAVVAPDRIAPVIAALGLALGGVSAGYVGLGFLFVPHAVALDGATAIESLRRSWQLASGRRLRLLALFTVVRLVHAAGAIGLAFFFIVGVWTIPLARFLGDAMLTNAYLSLDSEAVAFAVIPRRDALSSAC